jgi:hypothetical protein
LLSTGGLDERGVRWNPSNSLAQSCTDPSRKGRYAQHDENGGTESSNPLLSSGESANFRSLSRCPGIRAGRASSLAPASSIRSPGPPGAAFADPAYARGIASANNRHRRIGKRGGGGEPITAGDIGSDGKGRHRLAVCAAELRFSLRRHPCDRLAYAPAWLVARVRRRREGANRGELP